tara:strand:+ start:1430 stop:1870 length:441 start_codon:yes stop_codon:yes gene_type:complete
LIPAAKKLLPEDSIDERSCDQDGDNKDKAAVHRPGCLDKFLTDFGLKIYTGNIFATGRDIFNSRVIPNPQQEIHCDSNDAEANFRIVRAVVTQDIATENYERQQSYVGEDEEAKSDDNIPLAHGAQVNRITAGLFCFPFGDLLAGD